MPTTEKLKQEIADAEKKLAQERSRLQRLENRKSYYEKGDRKKRAHRLITRGAAVESIAPLVKALSETEFYAFTEKVFTLPEVRALLMEAVNTHTIKKARKERDKYRTISLPCYPDKTQCRAIRCCVRCLPIRGKAAQRVLRRGQRLHPERRCPLF